MTDLTPMQRARDAEAQVSDLARENERLREALQTVRCKRDDICELIEGGFVGDEPYVIAVQIGEVIDTALDARKEK